MKAWMYVQLLGLGIIGFGACVVFVTGDNQHSLVGISVMVGLSFQVIAALMLTVEKRGKNKNE